MMVGAVLMPVWSASSWDMQQLEVSASKFSVSESRKNLLFSGDTAGIPYGNAYFGAGTGPIYLDDVACTLSASQLLECSSRPILRHNCSHSMDAGVGCEGNIMRYSKLQLPFTYIILLQPHAQLVHCG